MKILFVDPPGKNKGLNTGLGYMSATLKEDHEVRVLDLNNIEIGICGDPNPDLPVDELEKRVIKAIDEFKPELLGISIKTFTADIAKHIFDLVNKRWTGIKRIAGGPHITLDGPNFVKETKIEFAIQGEGEFTIVELCSAITGKVEMGHIKGLIYRKGNDVIRNSPRDLISDLDSLPFPEYDNFTSVVGNGGALPEYPILTSRGCPYKCTYCSMPKIMGSRWRYRIPERVVEELKKSKEKYKNSRFAVVDDNFTLKLKRVAEVCNILISEKVGLAWNCQNGIRADRISEEMAEKMRRAGCQYVWIGIESADEKVFNAINKGEKLDDIKTGIRHLKKAGIQVGGFFIVGLPHSTSEADLKGVDFAREQGIDAFWFNFVPYPHTEAFDWVETYGIPLRSRDGALQFGANSIDPVFETPEYLRENRIKTYNEIHIKMHYFDRLVNPALSQIEKWPKVFSLVRPHGIAPLISLFVFILKYNIKLVIKKFDY